MSGQPLPWYRLYPRLLHEREYERMPREQRLVYRELLDYAALQRPRGTFQIDDMPYLAEKVAGGDVELLEATLRYCTTQWRCEDDQTTIVLSEDKGTFSQWHRLQGPRSSQPDAINERQRRFRAKKKAVTSETSNGYTPVTSPLPESLRHGTVTTLEQELEQDKDARAEQDEEAAAAMRAREVLTLLHVHETKRLVEAIGVRLDAFLRVAPELDWREETAACYERYHGEQVGSWIGLWATWMEHAVQPPAWLRQRQPPEPTPDTRPLSLEEALRDDAYGYAAEVVEQEGDSIVLRGSWPAEHHQVLSREIEYQVSRFLGAEAAIEWAPAPEGVET